jgi:hypothetical protein
MAKQSENTPDALFEIDAANWRLIEEAYGTALQPNIRADVVELPNCSTFRKTLGGRMKLLREAAWGGAWLARSRRLVALSGHGLLTPCTSALSSKRTSLIGSLMSANDPKRT